MSCYTPYMGCHNHTDMGSNLRLKDSINKVEPLIEYAHECNLSGIVITEHEAITSHLTALTAWEKHRGDPDWEGFKLGLGNEIYLCNRPEVLTDLDVFPHFILIALNDHGHKGMRELSTQSWTKHSFMKGMYRVPTFYDELEEMLEEYRGDIVGCSACLGSPLDRKLLEYRSAGEPADIWEACLGWISYMKDIFGEGNFFLELQPNTDGDQWYVNQKLVQLSEETNTPFIITTDSHYTRKEDRNIHKTYLLSKDGEREVDEFYATTYVMTAEEIHAYMDDNISTKMVDLGLSNTKLIYDRIEEYHLRKDLHIPYLPRDLTEPNEELYLKYKDKIPVLEYFFKSKYDSDRHMIRDILTGIERHDNYQTPEGYASVQECLTYLQTSSEKMKVQWSAYLMQVRDYVDIAWECDSIVAPGRGSGVGFSPLYLLGITQIDPLKETTKTYPFRFMNPERSSVLDIDSDVMPVRRDAIIQRMKDIYGQDRVAKVLTLSTEAAKQSILTAGRGIGMDNDTCSYIASLVIFDRGQARSLHTMYYGNDEHEPSDEFIREMDAHPDLWEAAQKIEGLVSGMGQHAGGVIIVDEPFTESAALMCSKDGDVITQFDLHQCEDLSLIKIDLLATDYCSKIYEALMLLVQDNVIDWQGNLRDTYEKYLGVYTLERNAPEMWDMVANHKILSLFQMEKTSGVKALALVKPHSVDDLATINSVIRLMAQEQGAEAPLEKFARFHDDITQWYQEMTDYGLNEEEQELLKGYLGVSYGICEAQEYLMIMSMDPKIGGFSLGWADALRKAVAKKKPKDFLRLQDEFFKNRDEKHLSVPLTNYVWEVLYKVQRGYGFNKSHTLAYSICALQEMNLAYKYNIIYWNCANLVVDSGALDTEANDATDYGKMAVAIAKIQQENIPITLPLVEAADFGFKPDVPNDRIIFGLKGINSINTEVAQAIIDNRPYESIEQFCELLVGKESKLNIIGNSQMLQLIKAGCFTELHNSDRKVTMDWYLRNKVFTPCNSLGLSQMNKIKELHIIPDELSVCEKMINFKKYVLSEDFLIEKHIDKDKKMVKRGYHDGYYILDKNSQPFFKEHFTEGSVVRVKGEYYVVSEKKFIKEVDSYIQPLKDWFSSDEALSLYNDRLYKQTWERYASGNEANWNMQSLNYYEIGKNELQDIDEEQYGIVNFFDLPEDPEPYTYYTRYINGEAKQIPKYKISCIAGTVIKADNGHHSVTLSTKYGPVEVKVNKGKYSYYNKRISEVGEDGKKHVIEESWFKRGSKIRFCGIKRDEMFWPLNYADTVYSHTVNLITEINPDGTIQMQYERYGGQ